MAETWRIHRARAGGSEGPTLSTGKAPIAHPDFPTPVMTIICEYSQVRVDHQPTLTFIESQW